MKFALFPKVVGWGKDHSKGRLRMEPRSIQLPIASQEDCLRSRKDFMYITSSRTLCAGLRNGKNLYFIYSFSYS